MTSTFRHVGLIGKYHAPNTSGPSNTTSDVLQRIAGFLTHQGCEVVLDTQSAIHAGLADYPTMDVDGLGRHCDLSLVVGGDGTMLGVSRHLAQYGTPLIGINQGRLGFVTDIALEDFEATLTPMLRGEYEEDVRPLMHARVMRYGVCVFEAVAMNDVVVNRGGTSGMVELRIEVGGRFVSNQRADGLIIATPTGSTAYALSAGGPMMHPSIPAWVMAPIAPHNLSNRPIVLSDASEVAIEVVAGRDVSANFDMQSLASLQHGDRILVTRANHCVRFLHPRGWNYFATLRKKLGWNEGGE
ncbi:NAD kinase [Comamonas composti]|uniref:NAD kinase n=1 Tax=Comamonas composti TaxID=408558 RepID=UPI00047D9D66|nr:NAD kinase [Comamonas composti]